VRQTQRKRSYQRIKRGTIGAEHLIRALHLPARGLKHTPAGVFELLAWLEERLLPYNAWAAHLFNATIAIGDNPMPTSELRGTFPVVRDAHGVRENVTV